jgi:hypothetical protein
MKSSSKSVFREFFLPLFVLSVLVVGFVALGFKLVLVFKSA